MRNSGPTPGRSGAARIFAISHLARARASRSPIVIFLFRADPHPGFRSGSSARCFAFWFLPFGMKLTKRLRWAGGVLGLHAHLSQRLRLVLLRRRQLALPALVPDRAAARLLLSRRPPAARDRLFAVNLVGLLHRATRSTARSRRCVPVAALSGVGVISRLRRDASTPR